MWISKKKFKALEDRTQKWIDYADSAYVHEYQTCLFREEDGRLFEKRYNKIDAFKVELNGELFDFETIKTRISDIVTKHEVMYKLESPNAGLFRGLAGWLPTRMRPSASWTSYIKDKI